MISRNGSLRLFRLLGINVFVHWSWLLVAYLQYQYRRNVYPSPLWFALEYGSLFVIVLLHEFGHALATLSVGGRADTIMLWPLGGVAYVDPPHRPGAVLWSIFAGPLVNILLVVPLTFAMILAHANMPNTHVYEFFRVLFFTNIGVFIFNMLPIYPLDGGQILQSLLWFAMGYARALRLVSVLGFVGAAGIIGLAWMIGLGPFTYIMAFFIAWRAYVGYRIAQQMIQQTDEAEARMRQPMPPPPPNTWIPPASSQSGGTTNSWDKLPQ
jgi:Zn-dependent protease